jgi:DNA-binding XRE family transcriptional regulator
MAKAKLTTQKKDTFAPVPFDAVATKKAWMKEPAFREAYVALEDEFAVLDALLRARKAAGLTQEEVAQRMGVKQSALARIESSLGSRAHSPSLATLRRYAEACGKKLVINMV